MFQDVSSEVLRKFTKKTKKKRARNEKKKKENVTNAFCGVRGRRKKKKYDFERTKKEIRILQM